MADSPLEICNLALLKVGVKTLMNSLDEQSNEGLVSKTLFPQCRDEALTDWDWSFATARSNLAELEEAEKREGWAYAYTLPSQCLKKQRLTPATRSPTLDTLVPCKQELNNEGDGLILLTDVEEAQLLYTRRVENVRLFPPKFVSALVWLLAAEFVLTLPLKPELERWARERYVKIRNSAGADDANSQQEDETKPESKYIAARR